MVKKNVSAVRKVVQFPIWKTINLGTGFKTADDFRTALTNYRISYWANNILGKPQFTAAQKKMKIDLVVVSVADLGFKNDAYLKDIYKRALELGLTLCSNEVGPQLRLQYNTQPINEWLLIAMDPIKDSDGGLRVFSVGRRIGGSWLDGFDGRPDGFWGADNCFVFALPRK